LRYISRQINNFQIDKLILMSDTVIRVENLGKKYIIGHQQQERYTSLRDVITNKVKSLGSLINSKAKSENPAFEEFWALKDVSFDIKQGDRVGIIGRNGAGKSTLLKILSRITEPTKGSIKIKGRVASLLEVGTGFHPELTGRENIFLNGSILGMDRYEIKRKFDEIVDFAEVEKFLDTPVKRYSSGMYVRLAFSVAAHLEPEILIVDEVLAVGDAQFQKKCLGKMEDVGKQGRTVLFVSHNLTMIQRLCQTGIYLSTGEIKKIGNIEHTLDCYQKDAFGDSEKTNVIPDVLEGQARFTRWQLLDAPSDLKYSCYSRETCKMLFEINSKRFISKAFIGFAIWTLEGELILGATSRDGDAQCIDLEKGLQYVIINIRLPIKAGNYQLDISLNSLDSGIVDRWSVEPKLTILPSSNTILSEKWHGLLNEEANFTFPISSPIK
jgi:lipopolysaccharide transport system ATP-binding protein